MKTQLTVTSWLVPPSTEVTHFLAADNQLVLCNGVVPSYQLGELRKDLGYVAISSAIHATQGITGLYDFRQSATVQKILATSNEYDGTGTQLWYSTGAGFTNISNGSWASVQNQRIEAETFIGYKFFVGYSATDDAFLPPATLRNVSIGSTNIVDMPKAKYIKRFMDRMYVANLEDINNVRQPFRVQWSDVPVAGALTWPALNFLDVDFSEEVTGLGSAFNRLVIFTETNAFTYDGTSLVDNKWPGCASHRTIQAADSYLFYANKDNVWASTGGRPQAIGNDILQLVRNSNPLLWQSCVVDNEYSLYLGTTRANDIDYLNCLATFNVQTGMWRWRELAHPMGALVAVVRTGIDTIAMGNAAVGYVYRKSKYTDAVKYYSDNGKPILAWFRTKAYDFGDPAVWKKVSSVYAYCEDAAGLELRFRVMDKNQESLMPFKPIGVLKQIVNRFDVSLSGYFIQFEGKEYSTRQYFKFHGLTALQERDTTAS